MKTTYMEIAHTGSFKEIAAPVAGGLQLESPEEPVPEPVAEPNPPSPSDLAAKRISCFPKSYTETTFLKNASPKKFSDRPLPVAVGATLE